ncbi:MAG: hypothetical protein KAT65_25305 [Methanophagales archaeon]|nr:hypothetical protein [Methanophagales archaeon]
MNPDDLIKQARRIIANKQSQLGMLVEAKEFLRVYAGEKSAFFQDLKNVRPPTNQYILITGDIADILTAFINYVENGLLEGISIERKAQIDVVSDFIGQADTLLNSNEVHPAAPAVIIGAALEEFLRNWIDEGGLSLGGRSQVWILMRKF